MCLASATTGPGDMSSRRTVKRLPSILGSFDFLFVIATAFFLGVWIGATAVQGLLVLKYGHAEANCLMSLECRK